MLKVRAKIWNFLSIRKQRIWPHGNFEMINTIDIWGGAFVCCFMGPQQLMFYCAFRKQLLEILGHVIFWEPIFWTKSVKILMNFRKYFRNSMLLLQSGFKLIDFEKIWWNHLQNSILAILKIFRGIWGDQPLGGSQQHKIGFFWHIEQHTGLKFLS